MNSLLRLILLTILTTVSVYSAWRQNENMPIDYWDVVYLDVYFLPENPQYGWICGYEGRTLRTTDGGKSWLGSRIYTESNFPLNIQLESIHFVNESVGYTSGPSNMMTGGVIYKSTDGGANWFDVTPNNAFDIWGTYFLDENFGFVIGGGCDDSQYFWKTTDGGDSWAAMIYNHPGSKMADLLIYDYEGIGYAIGSGVLWKTVNGGRNWIPISNTGGIDWHEEITRVGNTFLIPYSEGCYGNTVTNVGGVRITHDEGKTWTQYNTGVPMFGTFLQDELRGWGVGFNASIIYTSDGGKSWITDNCGILPGASLDDVWFINDTTGWAVGNGIYEYFVADGNPPIISSQSDGIMCEGDSIVLTASAGYDAYLWSNGESTQSITVSEVGEYSVRGFVDSICYNGLSESYSVKYYDVSKPEFVILPDGVACEGDTVELGLKGQYLDYEWFDGSKGETVELYNSGTYAIKLIDTNGCVVFSDIDLVFSPNPNPKILIQGRNEFCSGDSILLYTSEVYSTYKWYSKGNNEVISDEPSIWISSSGDYYVEVSNSSGCNGISEPKNITVTLETDVLSFSISNDNSLVFDSVYYSRQNCKFLTIRNNGNKSFILDDVYIFRNIAFSTPQSQFPIEIGADESVTMKICFSAEKLGTNLDTMIIFDNCTDRLIRLSGYCLNEVIEDLSKCDVPLQFEMINIDGSSFSMGLSKPQPNPADNSTKILFSVLNDNQAVNQMNTRIVNMLGYPEDCRTSIISTSLSGNILNGEIYIDSSELKAGVYLISIELYGEVFTETFTVVK